jgi:integrase
VFEMDDDFRERMQRRRERLTLEYVVKGRRMPAWVFPDPVTDLPPRYHEWTPKVWRRVLRAARVPRRSPKWGRHTYGSLCYRHTGDLAYVQSQLGHERPETTARFYVHFRPAKRVRIDNYRNAVWDAMTARGYDGAAVDPAPVQ